MTTAVNRLTALLITTAFTITGLTLTPAANAHPTPTTNTATAATTTQTATTNNRTTRPRLAAPAPRFYYSSDNGGYARGLDTVNGAYRYQIVEYTGPNTPSTVVDEVDPGELAHFDVNGNTLFAARAIEPDRRIGKRSAFISLGYTDTSADATFETLFEFKGSNVRSFGEAMRKFVKDTGVDCIGKKAFDAAYKALVKKVAQTQNIWAYSAATVATYYKDLYDMASTDACEVLIKMAKYGTRMVAAVLYNRATHATTPTILNIDASFDDNGAFGVRDCQIRLAAMDSPDAIGPIEYTFDTHHSKADCSAAVRNWYY